MAPAEGTGHSMSELAETALRRFLSTPSEEHQLSPLPRFDSDGALVDLADRRAVYRAMERQ